MPVIFITATMTLGPAYLDYGPPHVVREFPRQTEPRCALLVSVFVRQCPQIRTLHILRLAHFQPVSQLFFRESLVLGIVAGKEIGRTVL